jgi:hypothetical protein
VKNEAPLPAPPKGRAQFKIFKAESELEKKCSMFNEKTYS